MTAASAANPAESGRPHPGSGSHRPRAAGYSGRRIPTGWPRAAAAGTRPAQPAASPRGRRPRWTAPPSPEREDRRPSGARGPGQGRSRAAGAVRPGGGARAGNAWAGRCPGRVAGGCGSRAWSRPAPRSQGPAFGWTRWRWLRASDARVRNRPRSASLPRPWRLPASARAARRVAGLARMGHDGYAGAAPLGAPSAHRAVKGFAGPSRTRASSRGLAGSGSRSTSGRLPSVRMASRSP